MTSRQLYDERRDAKSWHDKHETISARQYATLLQLDGVEKHEISNEGILRCITNKMLYLIGRDGVITFQGRRGKGLS